MLFVSTDLDRVADFSDIQAMRFDRGVSECPRDIGIAAEARKIVADPAYTGSDHESDRCRRGNLAGGSCLARHKMIDLQALGHGFVGDPSPSFANQRRLLPPRRNSTRRVGMGSEIFLDFARAIVRQGAIYIGVQFL